MATQESRPTLNNGAPAGPSGRSEVFEVLLPPITLGLLAFRSLLHRFNTAGIEKPPPFGNGGENRDLVPSLRVGPGLEQKPPLGVDDRDLQGVRTGMLSPKPATPDFQPAAWDRVSDQEC
ncbi:Hypothetical predicted protein [Lynx pardinus]|uniref:Uncharacterized protein n=1 Tax=Lynx pardinus TaxID=191816 RepID=A0A485N2X2_LYNPA|nr:Hypothetical predicted protein [Lynx pardinus]